MIRLCLEKMSALFTNGSMNQRKVVSHTLTGLKRWSCHSRELPRTYHLLPPYPAVHLTKSKTAVDQVKALHVYDFDNTCKSFSPSSSYLPSSYLPISVFMSPLPNQKLWNGQTVGFLQTQECFVNGGWWHDQRILEATGQGIEKEEPKAWEGWWNEQIVRLKGDLKRPRLMK